MFTKNRERFINGDMARSFFYQVVDQAGRKNITSNEHFTVDGTLIEAWASQKSFQPKDKPERNSKDDDPGNPTVNLRVEKPAIRRMNRRPIPMRGWHARPMDRSRNWPTAVTS